MPELERLDPGQLIAERYRVGEVVGRGAMGIVYAGEHVRVGRRVAIKVLTRAWSYEPTVRQRFEAEARAASAAGHPNVIQVLDVGELPDHRLYLVMEFVDGRDLYTLLWAEGPLAIARACRLIRDAAFGVRAAHARGVIHRDLKLENVMVQTLPEGEAVKVLDFGIAAGVVTNKRATLAGMALGTPEYMAPEQVDGKPPTVAFDIYALGVMLFELLTKRLPIEADNPLKLMAVKGHVPAPRVSELRPDVPPALDQLISDCLEIDPSRRPCSCEVFIDRLTEVLDKLGPVPPRPTLVADPNTPPPRPSRLTRPYLERDVASLSSAVRVAGRERRPASLLWAAIGLLVLAGVGVGLLVRGQLEAEPESVAVAPVEPEPEPEPELQVSSVAAPPPVEPAPEPSRATRPVEQAAPESSAVDAAVKPVETTSPPQPADPSASARCEKQRARALDARRTHDWQGVLDATRERECWAHSRDRKKLETQAYMELGRFADCLRVGKHLTDTEVKKWVTLCNKRLAD